jgi:hypothetical protein
MIKLLILAALLVFISCTKPTDNNDGALSIENYPSYYVVDPKDTLVAIKTLDTLEALYGCEVSGYHFKEWSNTPSVGFTTQKGIRIVPDSLLIWNTNLNVYESIDSSIIVSAVLEFIKRWNIFFQIDPAILKVQSYGEFKMNYAYDIKFKFGISEYCDKQYYHIAPNYKYTETKIEIRLNKNKIEFFMTTMKLPCIETNYESYYDKNRAINIITRDTITYYTLSGWHDYYPEPSDIEFYKYGVMPTIRNDTVYVHLTYIFDVRGCWYYQFDAITGELLMDKYQQCIFD